jgi:hypothetical protein
MDAKQIEEWCNGLLYSSDSIDYIPEIDLDENTPEKRKIITIIEGAKKGLRGEQLRSYLYSKIKYIKYNKTAKIDLYSVKNKLKNYFEINKDLKLRFNELRRLLDGLKHKTIISDVDITTIQLLLENISNIVYFDIDIDDFVYLSDCDYKYIEDIKYKINGDKKCL